MDAERYVIWLPAMALVLARMLGLTVAAPVFGSTAMPGRLRVLLAAALSIAVIAKMPAPPPLPQGAALALALAGEFLVGLAVGYAAMLVIAGVEMGAYHISQQMGVSLAELYDPDSGESFDVVRRALALLAVVIFLAIGGHRAVVGAVLGNFGAIPPLSILDAHSLVGVSAALLAGSFVLAIQVAAPVLAALTLAALALGFVQKTMPQMNILSVGLPVRAMAGLLVIGSSLAVLTPLLSAALDKAMLQVHLLLGLPAGGPT